MKNSMTAFLVCIFLLPGAMNALYAQRGGFGGVPGLGRGPMALGIQYDYIDPSGSHQILGTFSQPMPLGFRRGSSGTPSFSRMSFLNLAGGIRFGGEQDSTEFRWRAGLLDGNINRRLILIGGTLLDYDKTGLLEKDFRWFNLRLGISPALGSRKFSITPRVVGMVGAGSWELGQANYNEFGLAADSSLSGVEAGYRLGLSLWLLRRLSISADYSERILVDGPEPHFKTWSGEARVMPGSIGNAIVAVYVRYSQETAELRDFSPARENQNISAGVRFTLIPRRPPVDPWDN